VLDFGSAGATLVRAEIRARRLDQQQRQFRWETTMPTEADHNRAGLAKLMLKMPALRGKLQVLSAKHAELYSLCGAFGDASATLERLRRNQTNPDSAVIADYENLCAELEQDIIRICLAEKAK
jgi:hypothetical protein